MTLEHEALADLRVVDLTGPAGYYCTKLLADLGADVVRVEHRDALWPDPGPFLGPMPDPDLSLYRYHFHTNKRSVELDLTLASGRAGLTRLLRAADILVETFSHDDAVRLGLDHESVHEIAPTLVHTSITAFGGTGSHGDYKASDLIGLAMGGLMSITGYPEDPPNQLGGEQAYHSVSLHAAVGTLLAVAQRDYDGNGRHVEVAMQDAVSMAILQTANFNFYTALGLVPGRTGNDPRLMGGNPARAVRTPAIFACLDGWVVYTTPPQPPHLWTNFVSWLAEYNMAADLTDPRFDDLATRAAESSHVLEIQQGFFATRTKSELYHEAQAHGLLCMPVQDVPDLLADEQLKARGFFVDVEHPEVGRSFTYPGAPYRLSRTPFRIKRRAPFLGEHNADVWREWLGESSIKERTPVEAIDHAHA